MKTVAGLSFLAAALMMILPVAADDHKSFRQRNINLTVGVGGGGGYDTVARLLARTWPKYIPGNPTIVVKNLPGAGSIRAADYLYKIAPKDGYEIGLFLPTVFVEAKIKNQLGINPELFEYIGRVGSVITVGAIWHGSSVKSLHQARLKTIPMAATFPGASSATVPTLMNNILGTRFKIILGYRGSAEMLSAMEVGEVEGIGATTYAFLTSRDLVASGKVKILFSVNIERHSKIKEIPTIVELATREDDRRVLNLLASSSFIGKTIVAPPGNNLSKTRVLQEAFDLIMQDKEFKSILNKLDEEDDSLSGESIKKNILEILDVSPNVLERYRDLTATK